MIYSEYLQLLHKLQIVGPYKSIHFALRLEQYSFKKDSVILTIWL